MRFAAIQGYHTLKKHLINTVVTHQVPHAQLFWGPEGNGSLSLVLAFLTFLNCKQRSEEDACGNCSSCLQMQKLIHPNVQFIFPTSATQQITGKEVVSNSFLKSWRSFISEHLHGNLADWSHYLNSPGKQFSIAREEARVILKGLSFKTFENNHSVVFIWLPEHLHATTANALLKVLEEPPKNTLFLLVSTSPEKILETIKSRTQQIYVPAYSDEAMTDMLSIRHQLSSEQLTQITLLANGNFNKATKLVKQVEGTYFDVLQTWMRLCYRGDFTQLLAQAETFQGWTKTVQNQFLVYALHLLRETLVPALAPNTLTRVSAKEQKFAQNLGKILTRQQIKIWIAWLNQANIHLGRNANAKILYVDLSLRLSKSFQKR